MLINLLATAWQTLLEQFDLKVIITVLLLAFFAVIEIIRGADYLKKRHSDKNKEIQAQEERVNCLEKMEQANEDTIKQVQYDVFGIKQSVDLLVESDKDDIRAWITEKYHYFTKLGYIDDFSLDCLERRFKSYGKEGGNSYVAGMMEEMRKLPRKNNQDQN